MGLVVNPTAFRIGYSKSWTDAWYLHRINYPVFVHNTIAVKSLVYFILFRYFPTKFSKWIYSHLTFFFLNNKFFINIYIYDAHDPYFYRKLVWKHKWGWFSKVRYIRFWAKKYMLDEQILYQRWFLLLQHIGINIEKFELDSLLYRLSRRELKKIENLKRKYGKNWVARESLAVWRFPIFATFMDSYNKMGMHTLNKIFKKFVFTKIKQNREKLLKNHSLIDAGNRIMKSYRLLYFIFCFTDRVFQLNPSYPRTNFTRFTYKHVFRFFFAWFIFRPFLSQLGKLLEWIVLYLNLDSKVRFFILENQHLPALYIARFFLIALRLKFDYRDMVIPIRKSLGRQMFIKHWVPCRGWRKRGWVIYNNRYKQLKADRRLYYRDLFTLNINFFYKVVVFGKLKRRLFRKLGLRKFIFNYILKTNLKNFLNLCFNDKKIKINKYSFSKIIRLLLSYEKMNWSYLYLFKEFYIFCYDLFNDSINIEFDYLDEDFDDDSYQSEVIDFEEDYFFFDCKLENINNFLFSNYNKNNFFFFNNIFLKKKNILNLRRKINNKIKCYFYFFFLYQFTKKYIPFLFDSDIYKNYISKLLKFKKIELRAKKKELNTDLEMIPLKSKMKRIGILDNHRSFLYGYKFHFVGRFTRKQKAASLWFLKGSNSVSSTYANVDYGFYTCRMRYSTCTVKVWLYKSKTIPIWGIRLI